MKKCVVYSLVLITVISLFFTFIPNVFSQPESVDFLSYSWYVTDYSWLIVVGEVQNVGPNIIENITLGGVLYTKDGEDRAMSYTRVYADQILPQQKAPFYMPYYPESSYSGDFVWVEIGIDHVAFGVIDANITESYQYADLEIIGDAPQIGSDGLYTVMGSLRNTGNRAAGRLWIVGTFYNASGHVIGVGYSNFLTPKSLPTGQTTSFTVSPIDVTPQMTNQITDYALLIQTEAPIFPEGPFEPPTESPTEAPTESPTESPTETPTDQTDLDLTLVLIAVPIVIAVLLVALFYRRKKLNRPKPK
ncbi:MAG: PT domain-containing protein [Candidatus Bathyarchaeum sp.]|nr:MAG: PT domain-containing protein [Candidatus Bathyarchaeum sp.]